MIGQVRVRSSNSELFTKKNSTSNVRNNPRISALDAHVTSRPVLFFCHRIHQGYCSICKKAQLEYEEHILYVGPRIPISLKFLESTNVLVNLNAGQL